LESGRVDAFKFLPEALSLVTDKAHYLYQERVNRPVNVGLVHAMLVFGFNSTLLVTREGDRALVVAGRGRVKACAVANKLIEENIGLGKLDVEERARRLALPVEVVREMPTEKLHCRAFVVRGDEARLVMQAVAENELRDDCDDQLTQAGEMARLVGFGMTHEKIGVAFGVSPDSVRNRLKLLEAIPEVRKALKEGAITPTDALRMAPLSPEDQRKMLEATPKKDPAAPEKRRPGKRGKSARPSKRQLVKLTDQLGDCAGTHWIRFFLGLPGAEEALVKSDRSLKGFFEQMRAAKRAKKRAVL
jgi:ParB family chromosome partitioning protein